MGMNDNDPVEFFVADNQVILEEVRARLHILRKRGQSEQTQGHNAAAAA